MPKQFPKITITLGVTAALSLGLIFSLARRRSTLTGTNQEWTLDIPQYLHRELLSVDGLEQRARAMATAQGVVRDSGSLKSLQIKLDTQEMFLREAYRTLAKDANEHKAISPAAEWLLDNFSLVLDQLREIREDLPDEYYRQLPKLVDGPLAGFPRVYAIAQELIMHTDGRLDLENLLRFVLAYQNVRPLLMGELWAIAIMLRVGLIENIGFISRMLLEERRLCFEADTWADRLLISGNSDSNNNDILAELGVAYPHFASPFVMQLLNRLHHYHDETTIASQIQTLERYFVSQFGNTEELIRVEYQRQVTNQATAGNTITSMRTVSTIDWRNWFEQVSLVEQILRKDPVGSYARSTFVTRDHYRHAIERLARGTDLSEVDIAWRLLLQAQASGLVKNTRLSCVGYYLEGKGLAAFEGQLHYKPPIWQKIRSTILDHPKSVYLGAIIGGTLGLVVVGLKVSGTKFSQRTGPLAAALLLIPASEVAQGLVTWIIPRILPPHLLPRLDLSDGIPAELRTMVVIPTLLLTEASVNGQFDRLEVIYLANTDPNLHFAILTDFADAAKAEMPEDRILLDLALDRINALNNRYGQERFFLFHRCRQWNKSQRCYMGWERKRGKLMEFNRLLGGATDTSFMIQLGDLTLLSQIRYVITLDADTQLPRDQAKALIGTLAHPLNQAVIDLQTNRVVDGYGILQPRIGIDLTSAVSSRFARIFSGNVGIDPYTTAVSNVYMDLFGVGMFAGKGIYDPHVLEQVLAGCFPENALLSHDLIEGIYARTALLSDVELLDNYPTTHASYIARAHRWVRGDWQLLPWLLPIVPQADGSSTPNTLPVMGRYKIFDNLRRSLVPPATVAMLLAGWLGAIRGTAAKWTALALTPLAIPVLLGLVDLILRLISFRKPLTHLRIGGESLRIDFIRFIVNLTFLADDTTSNLDAIGRTLIRLFITRSNLLEWETAEQVHHRTSNADGYFPGRLFLGLPPSVLLFGLVKRYRRHLWFSALPILIDWLSAPNIASWLNQPLIKHFEHLDETERVTLRKLARNYWDYFATFVTEEGNYLAPDNFQEDPLPLIAYRTSPTNIGLQLLADLSAYDFGYIGQGELTERTERTFATIEKLEHFHGHLLNWYDTKTLQPLPPAYISMVDSGNFVGYLLTLRQGYLTLLAQPIIGSQVYTALHDIITLLGDALTLDDSKSEVAELGALLPEKVPVTLVDYVDMLDLIDEKAGALSLKSARAMYRLRQLRAQVHSVLSDIDQLLPWSRQTPSEDASPEVALLFGPPLAFGALVRHIDVAVQTLSPDDHLFADLLEKSRINLTNLYMRQHKLTEYATSQVQAMDFQFLYDNKRNLFSIGYFVTQGRRDTSYYDLLASEARLGSFVAIAKGDVPQKHWFHLGRTLTRVKSGTALVSWSGTMFEYLMPLIVMRNYPQTLLDHTYSAVVNRQRQYGRQHKIPWGLSESAYNVRDINMNYQYHAFGVSGLGFKRGLGNDLVVSPYATIMALMVQPVEVMRNIEKLLKEGMQGAYGLYESVDYTPEHLPLGETKVIIYSFMVHHQAMSLLMIDNYLHNNIMQTRFHNEPMVQATQMLLQEQFSTPASPQKLPEIATETRETPSSSGESTRQFSTPDTTVPYTHLLSNGKYSVVITNSGAGFSRYNDLAVTRWHEDTTRDCWGNFCYIRDVQSGRSWASTYQPTRHQSEKYRVIYSLHKAEFHQQIFGIETRLEVTISPEDNAEVRHISLTNLSNVTRELEVTSYTEIVLAMARADNAHPAFSNLFVETEFLPVEHALLATRRLRTTDEIPVWGVQVLAVQGHTIGTVEYETDRAAFLGRGGTIANPLALQKSLSNTIGAVLDPIFSLRRRVRIVPGGMVHLSFTTAVAQTHEQAVQLADKYHDHRSITRTFDLALTESQVGIRQLELTYEQVHSFQQLISRALYTDGWLRAAPEVLAQNTEGQSALWKYGISGDHPLILIQIGNDTELSLVRELLKAHEYWRIKGLKIDLVFLNLKVEGYNQSQYDQLVNIVHSGRANLWLGKPGGIFLVSIDKMSSADYILLQTFARVVLWGQRGDLGHQMRFRDSKSYPYIHLPLPSPSILESPDETGELAAIELQFANEYGGFTVDGQEYVINLKPGKMTPAPWSNVIANESFGCIVTERGSGYTWYKNSSENRLTPWSNDPVSDPSGEAVYLHDEESRLIWSPLPQPCGNGHFRVRHGFGYSSFAHNENKIQSDLTIFVPPHDPVKIYRLQLHNQSDRSRQLSATFYVEWVLGTLREQMAPFVITSRDLVTGAILACNRYNSEFSTQIAFVAADSQDISYTCDRREFIGRNGDLAQPQGLRQSTLNEHFGAGLDPCTAMLCSFSLAPGEQREVIFLLGQGEDLTRVQSLVTLYRQPAQVAISYEEARHGWQITLQKVQVHTPEPLLDILLNGWLLYQTLVCRIWGRSAFYQSGGAYGFRDQLQDVMALVLTAPEITRDQILRAAQRQFIEGDVQHWWHPPSGRGIRTNFSDDYLWLPFVTCFYVKTTGDRSILDESLSFIQGRPLKPSEAEYYDLPTVSSQSASLYEHCIRAIEHSLARLGEHGLPLIGSGDWNDGMNLIGPEGKGESIWVGWFLYLNLVQMALLSEGRGESERTKHYRAEAERLQIALEEHAWNGDWYLRAFFDDGTPLGSAKNEECRIDSLPQSWAVISGAADPARARQAMNSVEEQLIDRQAGLIKLFTPPFDHTLHNPGYIKGYLPGVRENGGQYTHAAMWVIWAYTLLGEGKKALDLFTLINPITHSLTDVALYKVEPYVVAADIYAGATFTGRGGWTWYTGSSGWAYRLGVEMLLGLHKEGDYLSLTPCIPADWSYYEINYMHKKTSYLIKVENSAGSGKSIISVKLDGDVLPDDRIYLKDDGNAHEVRVFIAPSIPQNFIT